MDGFDSVKAISTESQSGDDLLLYDGRQEKKTRCCRSREISG